MFITFVDNLTGEFLDPVAQGGMELYIPAGDDSLLGYNDDTFTQGGFNLQSMALSTLDNFYTQ